MARTQTAGKQENNPGKKAGEALIFVVDDKEVLVQFAEAVLQSAGYQVRSFCDPHKTLEAIRETKPAPHLLVTDFDMGDMNGLELIVSSREAHPALKTIVLSGTVTSDAVMSHPVGVDKFLSKPYQPAQLTGLVAEVLRGK